MLVGSWGVASFETDPAGDWFFRVDEAPGPGAVMVSTSDLGVGAAETLDIEVCCEAIAAAELCARCAGQLPDNVDRWVEANPHGPHANEIELAAQAIHGCVRRASCVSSGTTQKTAFVGWVTWIIW
jgi:hypothetical protein